MLHSISNARFILHKLQKKHVISSRFLAGLNVWNESEGELSDELKHRIEKHWSSYVRNDHHNPPYRKDNKYYVLSMFPYPSGHLHMGHVRVYTISDAIARFQRLNGKHVIHPIGWDAFGLPAENAAIQRNIAPDEWTNYNIKQMKEQLERLGCSFQWERELSTCSKEYYKWTQELFLKLYNAGLVYQKESIVNWDPIDKTVLADEQVDENGNSWRSGAQVERKPLKQWFIRTTRYAKDLLAGLNDSILEDWRDIIKLQRHWIGECNGVVFDFKLPRNGESIRLWTKTPEYVEHARFILLKSDHILLSGKPKGELINQSVKLEEYAVNPLNGDKIPIFVCHFDEVDFEPFTDCYLGIPSICDSDTNFALKYNIPFKKVNKLTNSEDITARQTEICKKADELKIGGYWSSGKLRDWLISRQRYWGTPIPIVHCDKCGVVPIPSRDLPVILPSPGSDNCHHPLVTTNCPNCHSPTARRETDTLDTFVDSSWYYLRYLNTGYEGDMYDVTAAKEKTPVDLYIGGKEHAVLHLYYARFISHFLHSQGLLPEKEPFKRLLVQGMVMGRSYRIKGTGRYLPEEQVKIIDLKRNKAESIETGEPVVIQWEKMSKSKLNGVSPVDMFDKYSVDTTRLLILADVAPTSHRNWNTNTFPGILNWQRRLWLTIETFIKHRNNLNAIKPLMDNEEFKTHEDYLFDSRNYYIKGTTFNYCTSQQISVAISKMQGLTNSIRKSPAYIYGNSPQFERALGTLLILLAPIAPHFTCELWNGFTSAPNRLNLENNAEINWDKSIFEQKWPQIDYNYNLDLVFQINGYENSIVKLPRSQIEKLSKEDALQIALNQQQIKETLTNREITESLYNMYEGYEGVLNIITTCNNTKETNS